MSKVIELRKQQARRVAEARQILTDANGQPEGQALERFNDLTAQAEKAEAAIRNEERLEAMERAAAATPVSGMPDYDREERNFSFVRTLAHMSGLRVDVGRELEVCREQEIRSGRKAQGIMVPNSVLRDYSRRMEQRVVTSGGAGAGVIPSEHRPQDYIDLMRPSMVVDRMGGTTFSDLQGNLSIPKQTASAGASWIAENAAISATDGDWDSVTMTPKHVGARTEYSRNLLLQSSPDIELLVRRDFAASLAVALDKAALVGGGSNEPSGILDRLSDASALGTLADASWSQVLGLIETVEQANAAMGRLGWVLNPTAVRTLRSTPKVVYGSPVVQDAGAGFVMDSPAELAGYAAASTTSLPLAGGSPATLGTAIFGDFSSLLVGYWSGVDILVNPYESTAYSKGNVQVRGILTADVAVRHIESFAAARDVPAAS